MMEALQFTTAHYIKLGRGGEYVADSFQNDRLRFGWRKQSVEDIRAKKWKKIERQLLKGNKNKLGPARADLNALRRIAEAGPDEVWVTFHEAKMWWTRVVGSDVTQDEISKYRQTLPWSDKSVDGDRLLIVNDLPGKIAKLQGFRATTCRVKEIELLQRLLNGTRSPLADDISRTKAALADSLTQAIRQLHWKDFETLVDLVFRHAGWLRVSVLGQQAKGYDLELREPITSDRNVVQVKSTAGLADLKATCKQFSRKDYKRVFFVVHSPEPSLSGGFDLPAHVELVSPQRLGELALDAGLSDWLEDKVA